MNNDSLFSEEPLEKSESSPSRNEVDKYESSISQEEFAIVDECANKLIAHLGLDIEKKVRLRNLLDGSPSSKERSIIEECERKLSELHLGRVDGMARLRTIAFSLPFNNLR